jgi:hypothetical protein
MGQARKAFQLAFDAGAQLEGVQPGAELLELRHFPGIGLCALAH